MTLDAQLELEALLEPRLEERPTCVLEENIGAVLEAALPSVFTDYLDLLLQRSTTCSEKSCSENGYSEKSCPEKEMTEFECIRCRVGRYEFLIPIDRIQRIEKSDSQQARNRLDIPDCQGDARYKLQLSHRQAHIYVHSVAEILWVQSKDVIWRDDQSRAPWYVGTHKSFLCRLFDPHMLDS